MLIGGIVPSSPEFMQEKFKIIKLIRRETNPRERVFLLPIIKQNYMQEKYESVVEYEDLNLVSCLSLLEFPILKINSQKYPQVSFLFGKTKKLEEVVENFFNGSLLIEPKSYWAKIRELKSRIKSIKN